MLSHVAVQSAFINTRSEWTGSHCKQCVVNADNHGMLIGMDFTTNRVSSKLNITVQQSYQ
jgi:hypothetical protein